MKQRIWRDTQSGRPPLWGKEDRNMKEDTEVSRPLLTRPAAVGITGGQGIEQEDPSEGGSMGFRLRWPKAEIILIAA